MPNFKGITRVLTKEQYLNLRKEAEKTDALDLRGNQLGYVLNALENYFAETETAVDPAPPMHAGHPETCPACSYLPRPEFHDTVTGTTDE